MTEQRRLRENGVDRERVAEDRIRIVPGVRPGLDRDLRERLVGDAELAAHPLELRAEQLQRRGHRALLFAEMHRLADTFAMPLERIGEQRECAVERARPHLLEADRKRAFGFARQHRLPGEVQRRRARGAVVAGIGDRDPADADTIEGALARTGIGEHEAREGLVDELVVDARVGEGGADGGLGHHVVGIALPRAPEGHHSHSGDDHVRIHAFRPLGLIGRRTAPAVAAMKD